MDQIPNLLIPLSHSHTHTSYILIVTHKYIPKNTNISTTSLRILNPEASKMSFDK